MIEYDKAVGVRYASIELDSGTASATLVAAVSGKQIVVLGGVLSASGDSVVTFQSKPTGDAVELTGNGFNLLAAGTSCLSLPYCRCGLFQTAVGSALQMTRTGSTNVGGVLVYVLV